MKMGKYIKQGIIILVMFAYGSYISHAQTEKIIELKGIPVYEGVVFRSVGPEEMAKIIDEKTIYPYRVENGQFTPRGIERYMHSLTPEEALKTLELQSSTSERCFY